MNEIATTSSIGESLTTRPDIIIQSGLPDPELRDGPPLGIFSDISNEEYHRGPGISKSGLSLIVDRSPGHYMVQKLHPKPSKDHYVVGTATHAAVLEPEVFKRDFIKDPFPGKRTKSGSIVGKETSEAKAARKELKDAGKTILYTAPKGPSDFWDRDDWNTVLCMRDAVANDPTAGILLDLSQGKSELSVYWMDKEVNRLCRCRPDFLNEYHNLSVDFKTAENASYSGFGKSCGSFTYYMQDPFYSDGLLAIDRPVTAFVFVVVEKEPPYGVATYLLKPEEIQAGRAMYRKALDIYNECKKAGHWPTYPPGIRDLGIPPWGLRGNIN